MEKDYTIDIDYLQKLALTLANNDEDELIQRDYIKVVEFIKRIRNNYKNVTPAKSLIAKLHYDADMWPLFKPFYPLAKKLTNTKRDIEDFKTNKKYQNVIINQSEVFQIIGGFFKEQGEFFYKQFIEFVSDIKGHFQFVKPNDFMDGETLYLHSVGEAFVSVASYPNICKLSITSHELTHVFDAFNNPNYHEHFLIRETSAIFMEMIACDYLDAYYNLMGDNYLRKANLHMTIKEEAQDIYEKKKLLKTYLEIKDFNENIILAILKKKGYKKELIEYYESETLIENYYYILAQLVAIELYFIYRKDKKKALAILEEIIMNANESNIFKILKKHHIVICKNLNRYESELILGLKKADKTS